MRREQTAAVKAGSYTYTKGCLFLVMANATSHNSFREYEEKRKRYLITKVFLSLRLKQKSCVSGQPPRELLRAAARSSAASPAPPQPWKAALAGSLLSSAGTFLGKTCEVKQHARTHCSPRGWKNPPSKAKTQYKVPRKDPSKPARLS